MRIKHFRVFLLISILLFLTSCVKSPQLAPSNIELSGATFETSSYNEFKIKTGGSCETLEKREQPWWKVDVELNYPDNSPTSNSQCLIYVNGQEYPLNHKDNGVFYGVGSSETFTGESLGDVTYLSIDSSHTIKVCCKGDWESIQEPVACQDIMLRPQC